MTVSLLLEQRSGEINMMKSCERADEREYIERGSTGERERERVQPKITVREEEREES